MEKILAASNRPDIATTKGLRDRAIVVQLSCGLRRSEVAVLALKRIQQRDGRWCIVDLVGKHGRVSTAPMTVWVKAGKEGGIARDSPRMASDIWHLTLVAGRWRDLEAERTCNEAHTM
jgi:hypothetical protein